MKTPETAGSRHPLRLVVAAAALVLLAACSSTPDSLTGKEIAKEANAELTKGNPDMVEGELTCKDAKYAKGATSRCVRTVDLGEGQIVRIGATVEITSVTDDGYEYEVTVDDEPSEFGLSGESIAADLKKQYGDEVGTEPDTVDCPYLQGEVGTKITCTMALPDEEIDVEVTTTAVDEENFNTDYEFKVLSD